MYGVILDMTFNFCDAFYRCCLSVIGMSIYYKKTHLKVFQFVFYHDACFSTLDLQNKMALIWVSFYLVVIKPFENILKYQNIKPFEVFYNFSITSFKSLPTKKGVLSSTQLVKSILFILKNKSYRKMLNVKEKSYPN